RVPRALGQSRPRRGASRSRLGRPPDPRHRVADQSTRGLCHPPVRRHRRPWGSPPPGRRPRPSHVSGRPPRRDRADPRSARARGRRMRVVIAGAGSVGRSVARELIDKDHSVLLIDQSKEALGHERIPGAEWLLSDACELAGLAEAALEEADVVVAATGDDKTNLVLSLLAKTEFGVPRTVSRVNNPKNEWLFDDNWGVDVAVSTPRLMTSLVEEAVEVGGLVHLMSFE